MNHTPTPWQVNHFDPTQICDADGEQRGCSPIARMQGTAAEKRANAAFIVQAVNSHDALVAACEAVEQAQRTGTYAEAFEAVRAALAAAKEAA